MYSVLIVDDEELMRMYLVNIIPSLCQDYQITGIAVDGIEAMELFERQKFDLVITDIRMPEMDGLSFAKYVYETSPSTKMIIISGYSDFEYARTSIKYHVYDYILKPINDNTLLDVLLSLKEVFIKEKQSATMVRSYSDMDNQDLQCEFLASLVTSDTAASYKIYAQLDSRNITFNYRYNLILLVTLDELDLYFTNDCVFDITSHHIKLGLICKKYLRSNNIVSYYNNSGCTYFLISSNNISSITENIAKIYDDLSKITATENLPKIIMSCGCIFNDVMNSGYSAMVSEDNLSLTVRNKERLIYPTITADDAEFIRTLKNICSSIYTDILTSSLSKLQVDISKYCKLFSNRVTIANILRYSSYIIKYINSRTGIKPKYIREAYIQLKEKINSIMSQKSLSETDAINIITDSITSLIACENIETKSEPNVLANQAKQYILNHYQEQISLSQIAEELGINNCYLSDLIHKSLGESYSSYLLKIRMERAAHILQSSPNIKIYEVATQVGFVSSKHFISVFKKYYGITPSKYNIDQKK